MTVNKRRDVKHKTPNRNRLRATVRQLFSAKNDYESNEINKVYFKFCMVPRITYTDRLCFSVSIIHTSWRSCMASSHVFYPVRFRFLYL